MRAKAEWWQYYYLPEVMLHEFGHTAGLGHAPVGVVMGHGHNRLLPIKGLRNYDKNGMEEVLEAHTH